MKSRIPVAKVIKPLDLADFAPEYQAILHVWANPPKIKVQELIANMEASLAALSEIPRSVNEPGTSEADKEKARAALNCLTELGEQKMAWLAEIWSQGPDPETHWTVEEIRTLIEETTDDEPRLYPWLVQHTQEIITEWRAGQKKA